jgi:hypothetical protein
MRPLYSAVRAPDTNYEMENAMNDEQVEATAIY